jgi:uncharacterized protein YegL
MAALQVEEQATVSDLARMITVKIAASDNEEVLLHAADAGRLSGFVDGAELWIKPYGAPLRVREPAHIDAHLAISGPGILLVPPQVLSRLSVPRGAMVEISSAKPRRPPIYALFRYDIRGDESGEADLDLPIGVPPDLLQDLPRRKHGGRERLIILFDNSGSMAGRPIEDAKAALQTLIQCKTDRPEPLTGLVDEVGLIRFGSTVDVVFRPTVDFVAEAPKVLHLTADGGTPMEEALGLVPSQFTNPAAPWRDGHKRCIIITDGGASVSDDCIESLVKERVEVVAIEIGTGTAPVLQALATATGGAVVNADSLWKLDVVLARLA